MVNLNWQKYPVYKSSGVEWLGDIPEGWEVRKIKRITQTHKQGYYTEKPYIDEGIKLARITDIDDFGNVLFENMPFVEISDKDEKLFQLKEGDFLFARSGTIGRFGLVSYLERSVFASYLIRFRFKNVEPEFLKFSFSSSFFKESLISTLHGGANKNVHAENIKEQILAIPPLPEQQAIAYFLDHKLAQIDEYIAKKQRMIELLKEQKTVIINQAVTKGLNPDVPMKYSGIEWLGDIPEHWEVVPAFAVFKEQCVINRNLVEKNLLSLSYGQIIRKSFTNNFGLLPESFETYQIVTPGNIILRLTDLQNDKRSLRVGLVKEKGIITSAYLCLNPQNVIPEYVYILLHIYDILKVFYSMGSGVRQNMKFKDLKRLPISLPPISEQQEIVSFIEKKSEKINGAIATIEKEIKLIQEYRTTLISETVTGKIDVRKYRPTNQKTKTKTAPQ